MRVEFYGLVFETPCVSFYLWSPWRSAALEHRLFEAVRALPGTKREDQPDEWRVHVTEPKWEEQFRAFEDSMKDDEANKAISDELNTHENEQFFGDFQSISFKCDDVEKTHRELAEKGVEFEKPPTKQPWGTFAIVRDPDGNKFLIAS